MEYISPLSFGSSYYEGEDLKQDEKANLEAGIEAEEDEDDGDEEEEITVPLTISVSLLASYLGERFWIHTVMKKLCTINDLCFLLKMVKI